MSFPSAFGPPTTPHSLLPIWVRQRCLATSDQARNLKKEEELSRRESRGFGNCALRNLFHAMHIHEEEDKKVLCMLQRKGSATTSCVVQSIVPGQLLRHSSIVLVVPASASSGTGTNTSVGGTSIVIDSSTSTGISVVPVPIPASVVPASSVCLDLER